MSPPPQLTAGGNVEDKHNLPGWWVCVRGAEFILHSRWGLLLLLPEGCYANRCLLRGSHLSAQHTLGDAGVHLSAHTSIYMLTNTCSMHDINWTFWPCSTAAIQGSLEEHCQKWLEYNFHWQNEIIQSSLYAGSGSSVCLCLRRFSCRFLKNTEEELAQISVFKSSNVLGMLMIVRKQAKNNWKAVESINHKNVKFSLWLIGLFVPLWY